MADWQPGDLALCVKSGVRTRAGAVYTVADLTPPGGYSPADHSVNMTDVVSLRFREIDHPPRAWANSKRFRKVTPGADIEGFEERRRLPVKEDA